MPESGFMATIHFQRDDLDLFAAASHDCNPLHLSASYARKTAYGEPVVFGILGALAIVSQLPPRPGQVLDRMSLAFRNPLFPGIDYHLELREKTPGQVKASLSDAGRVLLSATFQFRAGAASPKKLLATPVSPLVEPATWTAADLRPGFSVQGGYAPAPGPFQALLERWALADKGIPAYQLAALLWASYLVGMHLPGERATFSQLRLAFPVDDLPESRAFGYSAQVTDFDERFDLLQTAAQLRCDTIALATAEIQAFVRWDSPVTSRAALAALLPQSQMLRGKTALVIGGSRGLGAALVCALASQGCAVYLNYHSSSAEAERLRSVLCDEPGPLTLLQGNAADGDWCRRMREVLKADPGGLDILICNASPAILPLGFALDAMSRFRKFVDESLALASLPLAACLEMLEVRAGWGVVISSTIAAPPPQIYPTDWAHYVAAKYAVEGMARAVAAQAASSHFLIARPPRLLTDQTNTTNSRQGAIPAEGVAAAVVRRLCQPPGPDRIEILENFAADERSSLSILQPVGP
jgi:NAD(P)-dependent dehydrogenase (short-subunit alcohol dehydrogenase family)